MSIKIIEINIKQNFGFPNVYSVETNKIKMFLETGASVGHVKNVE